MCRRARRCATERAKDFVNDTFERCGGVDAHPSNACVSVVQAHDGVSFVLPSAQSPGSTSTRSSIRRITVSRSRLQGQKNTVKEVDNSENS